MVSVIMDGSEEDWRPLPSMAGMRAPYRIDLDRPRRGVASEADLHRLERAGTPYVLPPRRMQMRARLAISLRASL
jgi:hypothetical protein